jgi:hypothetical protein
MNLFVLDYNPKLAVQYHNDKHIVKMILETAQLLSTAHRLLDGYVGDEIYKSTHKHHPCAVWVRKSSSNYLWAFELFIELLDEFQFRYKKIHLSSRLVEKLSNLPHNIPIGGLTKFALAMPDEFKKPDAVESYRAYYNGAKRHLFGWKNRQVPEWIIQ